LIPILVIFVLVFAWIGVMAIRNPLLARLAGREVVRRRGQSMLVVGGLMIGSAAITASLVAADSNSQSFLTDAYLRWGNVDVTVSAGSSFFSPDATRQLAADQAVARATDGLAGAIQVVGSASDLTRRQGEPNITLVGFDPALQREFGRYTLTNGRTTLGDDLGSNGVLLSHGLADALHARVGDRLAVQAEQEGQPSPQILPLRVAGIARPEGPGAFGRRPTVFAPLTLAQEIVGQTGINVVWLSANGGLVPSVAESHAAATAATHVLKGLPNFAELRAREAKQEEIDNAKTGTQFLRTMLLAMSFLIVAAGAALVVNLVLMLAEERRPRLGVLRALGVSRSNLVRLSVIEGAVYSLAAALIGTALGVGAGRLVAARFADAFHQFFGAETDTSFVFSVRGGTLAISFAAGALVTLVTVALAARRTSRMSIPAAIRDLPEPARERRHPLARRLALGAAFVVGVGLAAAPAKFPRFIGGTLLIIGAGTLLKRRVSSRTYTSILGAGLATWAFITTDTLGDPGGDATEFFSVFTVTVLVAVFGLSILASANLRLVERFAAVLGRASRAVTRSVRTPLAYLARRPLRTGLTTGIFGVIMAILALFSVFLAAFRPQYERDAAGYDVRVTSTGAASIQLPASVRPDVRRELALPTLGYIGPLETEQFSQGSIFLPLYPVDEAVGRTEPLYLQSRSKRFKTNAAVWAALAANPHFAVSDFGNTDQDLTLGTPRGKVTFTVIGQQAPGIVDGLVASPAALRPFTDLSRGATILVDVKDGVDAASVARRIESGLFSKGVDAQTTRKLLDDSYRASQTFFSVIDILMRMGLVVGILSLGILGLRAVVERRHVIGVLRAIGYRKRGVMVGLIAEAGATATLGVAVGVVTGFLMGYLFLIQEPGAGGFGVDFSSLGSVLALVYVAVLVVTIGPAWQASRLPPAEAVRYTE
jgi:putative ABC transport system permease protein